MIQIIIVIITSGAVAFSSIIEQNGELELKEEIIDTEEILDVEEPTGTHYEIALSESIGLKGP